MIFSTIVKILRTIKTTEDGSPEEATEAVYLMCDLGLAVARLLFKDLCKGQEADVAKLSGGCSLPQSFFRAVMHKRTGVPQISLSKDQSVKILNLTWAMYSAS